MFGKSRRDTRATTTGAATAAIPSLDDQTFADEISSAETPVLVQFWAEWSKPCQVLAHDFSEIAQEHPGNLRVAQINIDECPNVTKSFKVMSIPTLILFKDGAEQLRLVARQGLAVDKRLIVDKVYPFL